MKYLADEMIENLAPLLREKSIDCRTVHEWMRSTSVKSGSIGDDEVRAFILRRKMEGENIALVTCDSKSSTKAAEMGLQVIRVPEIVRDFILNYETIKI